MSLYESLNHLLDDPLCNERNVHALLKLHPEFVTGMFADSWNYAEAYSEVALGSDFRVDFLVLCANSGYWAAHLVELKGPNAALFKKNGEKSREYQRVERQLQLREDWRRQNELAFRQALAKLLPANVPAFCSNASVHTSAVSELLDLRTVIQLKCHAAIGRSIHMSDADRELRRLGEQRRGEWGSPTILTYDRWLVKAKRLQKNAGS